MALSSFAEWFRKVRREATLSQDRLSDIALALDSESGVYQTRLSSWERGASLPSLRQLMVCCSAMRLSQGSIAVGRGMWDEAQLQGIPRAPDATATR